MYWKPFQLDMSPLVSGEIILVIIDFIIETLLIVP